jgi:purine-binding chemotaxis protein CheW
MNGREADINVSVITRTEQIVLFTLDELLYALPLHNVIKVIQVVEIRHLPNAPEIITGIINIKGRIIPVADVRKHFGLGEHEIDPDDKLIIADTGKREVAMLVDTVTGIRDIESSQLADTSEMLPFVKNIMGVAKADEGLVLIYDLEKFLDLKEEEELKEALNNKKNEL